METFMLRLHGFPVSNYTNMVRLALLEKDLPFEFVLTYGNQSLELLAKSPRGKVPFLQTPQGYINEASVILEYLEDHGAGRPLLSRDPYERAQTRALMKEIELYIELPAHACYPEAIFGLPQPEAIKAKACQELLAGVATLKRHGRFSPFVAGNSFTLADIVFLYSVDLAALVARRQFGVDLLEELPAAVELLQRLGENANVQAIAAECADGMPAFIARIRAHYGAAG
jgi:glutathione S-transferase